MTGAAAAVLLMGDASRSDEQERELEQLLGRDGRQRLRSALVSEATGWGRELAPDALRVAPAAGRLADATNEVFATHGGPMIVVWPCLPRLRPELASAALGDLAAGCDLVLGPVIDGGLYLLGLARPMPELFSLPDEQWQGPDVMTIAFEAARDSGLEVGILRAERALHSPADVRAALADPLTAPEIAKILRQFAQIKP
jgi:glycosyltransferase A (GT-A) superfamily protein (DUF2064 family)